MATKKKSPKKTVKAKPKPKTKAKKTKAKRRTEDNPFDESSESSGNPFGSD